jgi:hypothetical protein
MEPTNNMELDTVTDSEDYYEEDDYDMELDCPTDSEEPIEVTMMYLDIEPS